MSGFTISALAHAAEVGVETVRYYQRRGLLTEPPRPNGPGLGGGVRRYGDQDVRRLRFIRSAQKAGFTLKEIAKLLELDATDQRPRALELARTRVAALDEKISELIAARDALNGLVNHCSSGGAGPCPIIEAFEH